MGNTQTWTSNNIPDLKGKVVVITGANTGLGYESAKQLLANGADVIMACRSVQKAQAAADELKKGGYPGNVSIEELDLSDLDQVATAYKAYTLTPF